MKVDLISIRDKFGITIETIQRLNLLEEKILDKQITEQMVAEISEIYIVSLQGCHGLFRKVK